MLALVFGPGCNCLSHKLILYSSSFSKACHSLDEVLGNLIVHLGTTFSIAIRGSPILNFYFQLVNMVAGRQSCWVKQVASKIYVDVAKKATKAHKMFVVEFVRFLIWACLRHLFSTDFGLEIVDLSNKNCLLVARDTSFSLKSYRNTPIKLRNQRSSSCPLLDQFQGYFYIIPWKSYYGHSNVPSDFTTNRKHQLVF